LLEDDLTRTTPTSSGRSHSAGSTETRPSRRTERTGWEPLGNGTCNAPGRYSQASKVRGEKKSSPSRRAGHIAYSSFAASQDYSRCQWCSERTLATPPRSTTAAESPTPRQAVRSTDKPPAAPLFPRTRGERLGVVRVQEATCLPGQGCRGLALPALPESSCSPLSPCPAAPVPALVASQGRAPLSLFPRREWRITQRCLTLKPGSGQSPVASPAPGYFYTPLRVGMRKGETLTSPSTPGNQLPSEPAASSRGFPGASSVPVGSYPPRSGRTAKTLFQSPTTAPSNTQRSPLAPSRGLTTLGRGGEIPNPAQQQAPTCVSGLGR